MNDEAPGAHWHALDPDEALKRLDSSTEGLTGEEATRRLQETGLNLLEAEEEVGPLITGGAPCKTQREHFGVHRDAGPRHACQHAVHFRPIRVLKET